MKNQVGAIRVISNTTGDVTSQKTKYDGPKKWFRKEHEDVINPITAGNQELLQRQEDIIKLQDDALMDISKGIDRLHEQVPGCLLSSLPLNQHGYFSTNSPTSAIVQMNVHSQIKQ
jgi:hypothetical protein